MPELPEVEVVRAGIAPVAAGAVISGVRILDQRSLRRHDASAGPFAERLTGRSPLAVVRRGKFLWLPLDSGEALVVHLGMSGQVLVRAPGDVSERMLRIRLTLDHPEHGERWLDFVDQRVFGSMALDTLLPTLDGHAAGYAGVDTGEWAACIPSQVAHIARDPLDPAFSAPAFYRALTVRASGIKRVLLDQRLMSGVGNIYADEALFAARIHYDQPAESLSPAKARTLLAAVRTILRRALGEGGTSFDAQYVNVNGQSGYFAHSLEVYGRHGAPCSRCGSTLVREQFMNRGSHFCPRCQRLR